MSAEEDWKNSHKKLKNIKDDQKECTICGCPVTKKDYDEYKMCPWCYSESVLDNEGGGIF